MASWLPTVLIIGLVQLIDDRDLADAMTILVAILGTLYSAAFVIRNFYKELQTIKRRCVDVFVRSFWLRTGLCLFSFVALILMLLCHLIIGLLIAFYFH